jgi:hypothetical protein
MGNLSDFSPFGFPYLSKDLGGNFFLTQDIPMPILPRTSGARLKFCPGILAPSPWKGLGQGVLENWNVGKGLKSRESSLLSFSITPELHYSTTPLLQKTVELPIGTRLWG